MQLTFGPERTYLVGLGLGAIGVLLLLLLAVGLIGRHRWEDLEPSPPWNKQVPFWLAIGLAAVVIFVIGGPVVLAVPVLAYVGSRRPVWLPWVAFVGMAIVAVVAAVHPGTGALSGVGAFSGTAQVCALIALSAVLVPVAYQRSRAGKEPNSDAADVAPQPEADAESAADAESVLAGGTS